MASSFLPVRGAQYTAAPSPAMAGRRGRPRLSTSQLRFQQCRRMLEQLLGQRPVLPLLERHRMGPREVALEDISLPAREVDVQDVEVGLVVERERAAVEIGR